MHLWLGLVSGLVVFVEGLTGCIYVFYEEISHWAYQDRLTVAIPENPEKLSIEAMKAIASTAVPAGIKLSRIAIPAEEGCSYHFIFDKTNKHAWSYSKYKEFYQTIFINPYTGEIIKVENTKWEFFNVILWLHMTLLTGYSLGGTIVKWSVYGFIVLLLSGLILWWPWKRKKKGSYFWFQWKPKTNGKRKNYDLHRIPGFYVFSLALIFAFTGLFWASTNINHLARWMANGGQVVEPLPWPTSDTTASSIPKPLQTMYQHTKSLAPDASFILIRLPSTKSATTVVRAYREQLNYQRSEYLFDQYSGTLLKSVNFESRNGGDQLAVLNYDIHVGTIGGMPTKILAFIGSLLVASLPITGFFIWRNKKRKPAKPDSSIHTKPTKRTRIHSSRTPINVSSEQTTYQN